MKWKQAIAMREGCMEKLAPNIRDAFNQNLLSLHQLQVIAFMYQFTTGVILLKGPAGAGKTLTMTQVLYNLNRYFGMPVITDYELKPAFGPRTYQSTDEFIEELKKIDEKIKIRKDRIKELSDSEVNDRFAEYAEEILSQRGIVFDGAAIGWDEANRKLEASRANSKLVMTHRYYVQVWRHHQCALILSTPELSDITPKAINQLTIELGCSYDPRLQVATAMGFNRTTMRPITMYTYMPNYCMYYETHAPISIRDVVMSYRGFKL